MFRQYKVKNKNDIRNILPKKNPPQLNEVGFNTNYFDTKTKLVQILFLKYNLYGSLCLVQSNFL
jgi:hypothetical protein